MKHRSIFSVFSLLVTGALVLVITLSGLSSRAVNAPALPSFSYPYNIGDLSFPRDEGKHPQSQWPMTIIEWFAHYAHLTAEDGSRYFIFTTFVTYDPIETLLSNKFPHMITTLVDVDNEKTYHFRDMTPLKTFAQGYADVESAKSDYFRWKGNDEPFEYDFHVAWSKPRVNFSLTTELKMVKPPLALNGSGYIKLPKADSGYYSQTRLEAAGQITINGVTKRVSGIQWVDRQWLGVSFIGNIRYSYDWWALQFDNNEEAIMFRIWDTQTDTIVMSRLEINHADGTREHVEEFSLTDSPSGWLVTAESPLMDLKIVPACENQKTWRSCDIVGTMNGQSITGVAAAELARNVQNKLWKAIAPIHFGFGSKRNE